MLEGLVWQYFAWTVLVLYSAFLSFIFLYSLVQLSIVWNYTRRRRLQEGTSGLQHFEPIVTIQLPVYNEQYVVERLINATASIDYSAHKLEIQVLDDSTDNTSTIVADLVNHWRSRGIDIVHIRRPKREGFKAGALAHGLSLAKGSFIAIFDADFLPPRDFLKRTLPPFSQPEVGVVQTRWQHVNRDYNLLTKLQAFGLDAHFTVEQGGRSAGGHFINFNGTAGIWRRETIEDAGGWSSDTLTEDLDLSYRAQLKGWKFVYLEEVGSPAELPASINALMAQQFRWTKGAAECAVLNLGRLWKKPGLRFSTRVHAVFHLMNSSVFICVLALALLSIPMLFIKQGQAFHPWVFGAGSFFVSGMLFLMLFYGVAYSRSRPNGNGAAFVFYFFAFLTISMGLSLHNSIAVLEGYAGRKSPFVRTPKFNLVSGTDQWTGKAYVTKSLTMRTFAECALSVLFLLAVIAGIRMNDYGLVPFHVLLSIGFAAVAWKQWEEA